jgi:hypothetical protein
LRGLAYYSLGTLESLPPHRHPLPVIGRHTHIAVYPVGEHDHALTHWREGLRLAPEHVQMKDSYTVIPHANTTNCWHRWHSLYLSCLSNRNFDYY